MPNARLRLSSRSFVLSSVLSAVTAATVGFAHPSVAVAAPARVVLVLLDATASMTGNGLCPTITDKGSCAKASALAWINNHDFGVQVEYHFWELRPSGSPTPVLKSGPLAKATLISRITALTTSDFSGFDTPLAGAYCDAVDFIIGKRLEAPPNAAMPGYIVLATDGLENATPMTPGGCGGVDSGAAHPFTEMAGMYVPLPSGGPYTSVNGLLVPSWQSNMLDKALTGSVHVPSAPPAFAPSGFPPAPAISEITFIQEFIRPAARMAFAAQPSAAALESPPARGIALRALSAAAPLAIAEEPSSTDDYIAFLNGLATATGGRFTRVGAGPPIPGDPSTPSAQPGDVDGDGCVDVTDANAVIAWLGKPATAASTPSLLADITLDGFVDVNDYNLLKSHYGEGCVSTPAMLPLGIELVTGFEDASLWSTAQAPLLRVLDPRTEGSSAVLVGGTGWRSLSSVPLSTGALPGKPSKIMLDVSVGTPSNPGWSGDVQMLISIPSAGVYNAFLGTVSWGTRPIEQFATVTFTIPTYVAPALATAHDDLTVQIVVNGTGTFTLDNLRFLP